MVPRPFRGLLVQVCTRAPSVGLRYARPSHRCCTDSLLLYVRCDSGMHQTTPDATWAWPTLHEELRPAHLLATRESLHEPRSVEIDVGLCSYRLRCNHTHLLGFELRCECLGSTLARELAADGTALLQAWLRRRPRARCW